MGNQFLENNLDYFDINFNDLNIDDIKSAYQILILEADNHFENKLNSELKTYSDFFSLSPIDKLSSLHSFVSSLNSMVTIEGLRDLEEYYSPILSEKFTTWSLNKQIFNSLCNFAKSTDFQSLNQIRQKMIKKIIKDLIDSGINLSDENKQNLIKMKSELSLLVQNFQNNITDAQANFKIKLKLSDIKGVSQRTLDNIVQLNEGIDIEKNPFYITESSGLISDVMINSTSESIRKKIYNKRKTLCSKGKYDNTEIIDRIYKLKQKIAQLLGYDNYATMVLEENMATCPNNALDFLNEVGLATIDLAKHEANFILSEGNRLLSRPVEWWDHEFICDKILKNTYSIDSEEIRKYFPVNHTVLKLFELCENLFGIKFINDPDRSVWNEDVIFYNVYQDNSLIGGIYLDLYKREGKMPGAWLNPISTFENNDINQTMPYAILVCNAPKDSNSIPTFELNECVTLFHEMGHALHLLLSKVSEEFYSGFNNVEHDAVEIPSQLLENFFYLPEVLKFISKNIEDSSPISDEIIDNIISSRKFLGATSIINMVKFSEMDLNLYLQNDIHPYEAELSSMNKWKIVDSFDVDRKRMSTFSHIFGGGYSAGYYAYQWAEVYAIEGFKYLTEHPLFSKESEDRFNSYKINILETGGSSSMLDNFIKFRGEKPNIKNYIDFNT